jgi:hypothetical protein
MGEVAEFVWMTWRGETSCSYWDSNSLLLPSQPVDSHYTDRIIPVPADRISLKLFLGKDVEKNSHE